MISDESTDEAHKQEQKEQWKKKEMTDNLMVDDDTEDECFDSENVGIHNVAIITGTFTMGDDLLSEPL